MNIAQVRFEFFSFPAIWMKSHITTSQMKLLTLLQIFLKTLERVQQAPKTSMFNLVLVFLV